MLPLVVAVGAIGLMFVQVMIMMVMMVMMIMMMCVQYLQLTKLRDHLRNPDMSSDEYRYKCRKTFWRMVRAGCLLLTNLTIILSADHRAQLPGCPGGGDCLYPQCWLRPHLSQHVPCSGEGDQV